MHVYDSALLEDQTPEEQETKFADVLEKTVNPMLEMCTMMADLMKADRGDKTKEWDTAVFLVNCLVYLEVSVTYLPLPRLKMNTGSPPTIFVYQAEDQRVGEENGWARSNSRGCTCEFVLSAPRLLTLLSPKYERLLHESALAGVVSVLNVQDPDVSGISVDLVRISN